MTYVVDTHSLIWFLEGDSRLSAAAFAALTDATATIVVPALALAELAYLYAHQRVSVAPATVLGYIAKAKNCHFHPLDLAVVERLPATLNIHDAIITATALALRDAAGGKDVALVTKDGEITKSGLVQVVW